MEQFLDILLNIGALIFVFVAIGFCVFSHELGHFLAAKWRGLHIDAFSIGFRPIWRKKINGVEYRIGWLPFGGYVELPQVDATDAVPKAADGTELPRAKALDRVITAVAGPLFNILSGLLLGCIVWLVGMPQDSPKMREITVLEVEEGSPEFLAGLRPGDKIVSLNGEPFFDTWAKFYSRIVFTVGKVTLGIIRDGKPLEITYTPIDNPNAPGTLAAEKITYPFFTPLIPIELTPEKDSPAARAGIRAGDLLVKINGEPVHEYEEFQLALDQAGNRPIPLTIRRGGEMLEMTVTPEPIPGLPAEFTRYLIGVIMTYHKDQPGVFVQEIVPNSPAQEAGLKTGDRLIAIDGRNLTSSTAMAERVQELKTTPFRLTIERDGKEETLTLQAREVRPHSIGVTIALLNHPTPFQQLEDTVVMSYQSLRGILVGLANKLGMTEQTSTIKASHMSGPLGIGLVLFNSVRYSSLISGIYFVVIISFALAIFNLFPLPVLDGGHILFGIIEIVFKKPLPTVILKGLSVVFVTLLIGLMLYVTFSDAKRVYRNFAPTSAATERGLPEKLPQPEKSDAATPQP